MWFITIAGLWSANTDSRAICPDLRSAKWAFVCVCVLQVLEEFLSYSGEMTHTDYSSMKMGDPYSIFMVDQTHECHMMFLCYLRNRNVSLFHTWFMDTVSFCRCAVSRFWQMPGWIRKRVSCSLRFVSLKTKPPQATPQNTLATT